MKYRVETVKRIYNTYVVEADTSEEAEIKVIDFTDGYADGEGISHIDNDDQNIEIENVMVVDA